ncbi:lactam utilization protein lamb [Rhodocollybia butyracea]|uniref:Lactam utilization protein lamb n=1 Tax=Rhodocollybia butyracea TaxID=206335 RepID=A0A9P5UF39_9AGAR|nr:lactam utilization protein lamb [Rhodocollybia butyracea]
MFPLKATVNCDLGEGFSLYNIADDESLMKTIHLANIACGFHASDFVIMERTVKWAKDYSVAVGAHPSLPDRQGFGRREMKMKPDELVSCFVYQVGALSGFLQMHGLVLNHIKPHGAIYGQTARSHELALAAVSVCKTFSTPNHQVAFVGIAGTAHQKAAEELGVKFIPEWFADLEYNESGELLITQIHTPVEHDVIRERVRRLLEHHQVTTNANTFLPLGNNIPEVTICCHSDTPGAVEIARLVKSLVDESNRSAGYSV